MSTNNNKRVLHNQNTHIRKRKQHHPLKTIQTYTLTTKTTTNTNITIICYRMSKSIEIFEITKLAIVKINLQRAGAVLQNGTLNQQHIQKNQNCN